MLPFKVVAADSDGLLSVCEFILGPWESGPVLHMHSAVDEAFFVTSGVLEMQLDQNRLIAEAGSFAWVPRGTAHTFANGSDAPVHVVGLATPGGIEDLFAEQAAHLVASNGRPDPAVLDELGRRYGAPTVGPPIRSERAPAAPPA
jgi:mannose-6-phosphate isomerase-like protein (cupin superfamily)